MINTVIGLVLCPKIKLFNQNHFIHLRRKFSYFWKIKYTTQVLRLNLFLFVYSYELSQDLIEKQIELLERKYGGDKARRAALVIQRAFRHYMLVKKFAHITAMAKAEKRHSKRLEDTPNLRSHDSQLSIRSGSLRERRSGYSPTKCNSLPRSRSGRCDLNYYYSLESSCSHFYSQNYSYNDMKVNYSTMIPDIESEQFFFQEDITSQPHQIQNFLCGNNSSDTYRQAHSSSECNQYGSSSSSSCIFSNSSTGYSSNISKNKVPPEVPKRTSSISFRSLREQHQNNLAASTLNKQSDSGSLSSVQSSGSDGSISSQSHNLNQTNSSVDSSMLSNSIVSWNKKSQVSQLWLHWPDF